MRKLTAFGYVIFAVCLLISCDKNAGVTPVVYKDTIINHNKIPPYQGVTLIQVQTYVNRLYIDLIGRIPIQTEMDAGTKLIQTKPFSDSTRQILVNLLINKPDYYKRFFQLASTKMLNASDSNTIDQEIKLYNVFLANYLKINDQYNADIIKIEVQKLTDLQNAAKDYQAGNINISGFIYRMLDNYFYDQVNMGTFNFMKSAFENLMHRSPTASEQSNSINMINGGAAILFYQNGTTKGDFINIMTSSSDFFEGQVVESFTHYLIRSPTSTELSKYTAMIIPIKDLKPMLLQILISKEYAGF